MERILSDLRRRRVGMLVKCTIIAAVFCAVWVLELFNSGWAEWLRWVCLAFEWIVTVGVILLLIKAFVETLIIAPRKLRAQLLAMPEEEREGVISAYPDAKELGERWFMPEHILFYTSRRAVILRYDAIKVAALKKDGDLLLATSSGDVTMPVKPGENAGVLYALLRSRNPEIKSGNSAGTDEKETERT